MPAFSTWDRLYHGHRTIGRELEILIVSRILRNTAAFLGLIPWQHSRREESIHGKKGYNPACNKHLRPFAGRGFLVRYQE